jgi:hypothetical protein
MAIRTRSPHETALYGAMKRLLTEVPALKAGERETTLKEVAKRLEAKGFGRAALILRAGAEELGEARRLILRRNSYSDPELHNIDRSYAVLEGRVGRGVSCLNSSPVRTHRAQFRQ